MFWIVVIVAVAAFVLYKRAKNDSGSQNSSGEQVSNQPQGNYRQALKYFRFVAEKQNSDVGFALSELAQFNIGSIYFTGGNGVAKDVKKAIEWFERAAEQGHADAQCNLGICYDKGIGVPKDMRKAVAYYTQAAEWGHVKAQHNLAICYYTGDGVPKDEEKAVAMLQKLAEQGHARSQFYLGMAYADKDDIQQAVQWWEKAAQQGDSDAQTNLELLFGGSRRTTGYPQGD